MITTAGIDVGSGAVKVTVMRTDGEGEETLLAQVSTRIRRREIAKVVDETFDATAEAAGVDEIHYIGTTGEGGEVPFATGHFYGMTTHARGALYLKPGIGAVLDVGALHTRAVAMDANGRVKDYKMTSQCASGSGQFLENIARYLGVSHDEIGQLSMQATKPEKVSSICAVLAETDVINMVSRGITAQNILKGIHLSMAARLSKLLKSIGAVDGLVMVTGGLALDQGLIAALAEDIAQIKDMKIEVRSHPDSIYAGAIGAALWGAYRFEKLAAQGLLTKAA